MEEEESKIKWSAVFAVIKRRLIWIVAITVTVAVLAGVLTEFVYNKGKDVYTVSFDLSSPSGTQSLPDGTAFSVQSLVYADNLNSVKKGRKFCKSRYEPSFLGRDNRHGQ